MISELVNVSNKLTATPEKDICIPPAKKKLVTEDASVHLDYKEIIFAPLCTSNSRSGRDLDLKEVTFGSMCTGKRGV